jgi:hypothetical protein
VNRPGAAKVMTVRVPDTREVTMVPLNVSLPLAAAAAGAAIAVGAASAIPRLAAPMTSVASCVPPVVRLVCSNHCHGLTRRAPEDMQAQNTTVGPTCRRPAYHPAMSAVSTSKWCPIRCHTQPRAGQCRRDKGAMEMRWRSRRSAPSQLSSVTGCCYCCYRCQALCPASHGVFLV